MSAHYAVLGYPLGHTMSPFIHEKLFAAQGVSASYEKRELPPDALEQALPSLRALDGFNLTIPLYFTVSRSGGGAGLALWGSQYGSVQQKQFDRL